MAGGSRPRPAGARTGGSPTAGELERLAGGRILRTFDGLEPTAEVLAAISAGRAAGVTLFRARNVGSPAQLLALADALQAARPAGEPGLVIGLDQEGGQLQAVGEGATAWPGNLALGATGSEELAEAAGRAIGSEAAAMGASLVFAPDVDVLRLASATPLGTRSFGSDSAEVSRLGAAVVRGLQDAGVAAVAKHFPGHGSATGDSHDATPVIPDAADVIRRRDLPPFEAGIAAGVRCVLPGHLAAPALTDGRVEPATTSRALLDGLLRQELGFRGVTVSDALDMGGAGQPRDIARTAVAAVSAGMDLLLLVHPTPVEEAVLGALAAALADGRLELEEARQARERIDDLRRWLGSASRPSLDVVGCEAHRALARRIAEASVTLVRDPAGVVPLGLEPDEEVTLLAPTPVDLTPAETSSYLRLSLADALRARGARVRELVVPLDPTPAQVASLVFAAAGSGRIIVGTFDAVTNRGQAGLVQALRDRSRGAGDRLPIAVALRSPYDVALHPPDLTATCTYGVQPPQMEALVSALVGAIPFTGRLPVALPAGTGPGARS